MTRPPDSRPRIARLSGAIGARPRRSARLRRARIALGVAAALSMLALPASAGADVGTQIIKRCTHGQSLAGFSQQDYRKALQEMPTEVSEYTDCGELIHQAELAATGGGSGPTGGGPGGTGEGIGNEAIAQTPAERQAVATAARTGNTPIRLGAEVIRPGIVHANIASAVSSLPTPLLAVLALLLACGAAVGGKAIRDRVTGTAGGG